MVSLVCLHTLSRLTHWVRYDDGGCGSIISCCKSIAKKDNDQKSYAFYEIGLNLGELYTSNYETKNKPTPTHRTFQ
ncbi:MAG: hypothetical protein RL642_1142 [Bacteroidota bacterium]|jgi:hypothetical protein